MTYKKLEEYGKQNIPIVNEPLATLLRCDDWEGLYINGVLIDEGHSLNDPNFWINVTVQYGIRKVNSMFLKENDLEDVEMRGSFPENINNFKNNYE